MYAALAAQSYASAVARLSPRRTAAEIIAHRAASFPVANSGASTRKGCNVVSSKDKPKLRPEFADGVRCRLCGWPAAMLGHEVYMPHGGEWWSKFVRRSVMHPTWSGDPQAEKVIDESEVEVRPGVKSKKQRETWVRVYGHLCSRPGGEEAIGGKRALVTPNYECSVLARSEIEAWPRDTAMPPECYWSDTPQVSRDPVADLATMRQGELIP